MTVETLATELGLWAEITTCLYRTAGDQAPPLLTRLAALPVRRSRATRSLGSYVSRQGLPVCIRLQFAQEPETLKQTLLHEIAHACDHLSDQYGNRYRRAHGPQWQAWARALGTAAESCGKSEALNQLYQQRLKLVAVCQTCGTEFRRIRRLNRRRKYFHSNCGGRLRPV